MQGPELIICSFITFYTLSFSILIFETVYCRDRGPGPPVGVFLTALYSSAWLFYLDFEDRVRVIMLA